MTEQSRKAYRYATPPAFQVLDRWTVWYNRISQVFAWVIVGYEVTGPVNHFVLLFAAAMMLGPVGLRLIVKGVGGLLSEAGAALEQRAAEEGSQDARDN